MGKAMKSRPIDPGEPKLCVFVSSPIETMKEERERVRDAICSIGTLHPWLFEYTPASSQEVHASYESKAQECDLFILVAGSEYSEASAREYDLAVAAGRPVLAFVVSGKKSAKQEAFVKSVYQKHEPYDTPDDLYTKVIISVNDEQIRRWRSTIPAGEVPNRIRTLPMSIPNIDQTLGYVIIGIDDPMVEYLYSMFGIASTSAKLAVMLSGFDEVCFDDPNEMVEAFNCINRAQAKAASATTDQADAFEYALKEEAISAASHYIVGRQIKLPKARNQTSGFRYFIWGLAADVAQIVRLMRPQEIVEGHVSIERTGRELIFSDAQQFVRIHAELDRAVKLSQGNPVELRRLVVEAALRVKLLK